MNEQTAKPLNFRMVTFILIVGTASLIYRGSLDLAVYWFGSWPSIFQWSFVIAAITMTLLSFSKFSRTLEKLYALVTILAALGLTLFSATKVAYLFYYLAYPNKFGVGYSLVTIFGGTITIGFLIYYVWRVVREYFFKPS